MSPHESHRHNARSRPQWLSDVDRVRQGNIGLCANALRTLGVATITEIAEYTDLSRPTVKERLLNLEEIGLAVQVGLSTSTRASSGRPANRFAFNANAAFIVGVELTRFNERILVTDFEGKIVKRHDTQFGPQSSPEARFDHLIANLDDVIAELSETHGACLGIGIALPGIISLQEGVSMSPLFPQHLGRDVAERFSARYDVPVIIENDINAAALAESAIGASQSIRTSTYVFTWHELAAGIIINGRLHRGARNAAGEVNLLRSCAPLPDQPDEWNTIMNANAAIERVAQGDENAREIMEAFLRKVAHQITAFALAIDPEIIVLGGALTLNDFVINSIRQFVREEMRLPLELRIEPTKLGADAPALGVLHLAFMAAIADIFGDKNAHAPVPDFGTNRNIENSATAVKLEGARVAP